MIRSRFRFVCLLAVCLAGVFVPFCVSAQEEGLRLPADTPSVRVPPIFPLCAFLCCPDVLRFFSAARGSAVCRGRVSVRPSCLLSPFHRTQAPYLRGSYATGGVLRALPRGAFYARGRQEVMPMWGRVNEAAVGYAHRFNQRLMLQAEVYATQVGLARFAGQSFGAAGNLVYCAADRPVVPGLRQCGRRHGTRLAQLPLRSVAVGRHGRTLRAGAWRASLLRPAERAVGDAAHRRALLQVGQGSFGLRRGRHSLPAARWTDTGQSRRRAGVSMPCPWVADGRAEATRLLPVPRLPDGGVWRRVE